MFYPGQSYKPEELDPGPAGGPYVHKPHNKTRVQAPRGRAANDALLAAADFRAGRLLSGFVSEAGRLLARRATKVDARVQRQLAKAVKTARSMALMPYDARPPEFARAGRR